MGALLGIHRIPVDMLSKILSFTDDNANCIERNGQYLVQMNIIQKIDKLCEVRQTKTMIVQ